MDTRNIWLMIFISCYISTIRCANNRTMTECHNAGVKCSRWSSCILDTKSNYICRCVAGYMGDLCEEDRNECEVGRAPCNRKGVCHNSVGSFRCDCVPGWTNLHCQTPDGSGLDTCKTGYTGLNRSDDFDECKGWTNPCEHNGTCANSPGNFTCICTTGWEGIICNEDIDECNITSGLCHSSGNCTNIPGGSKCDCPYPYNGAACYVSNDNSDGGTNLWIIIGPVLGILVIAGTVGAGLFVYNKYYRKAHKIDAGNETDVETITKDSTTGDQNTNSKWTPTTDSAMRQ